MKHDINCINLTFAEAAAIFEKGVAAGRKGSSALSFETVLAEVRAERQSAEQRAWITS